MTLNATTTVFTSSYDLSTMIGDMVHAYTQGDPKPTYTDVLAEHELLTLEEIADRIMDDLNSMTVYSVVLTGGNRDGETLFVTTDKNDAIRFAHEFCDENESDFDPVCGGVGITTWDGSEIVDW